MLVGRASRSGWSSTASMHSRHPPTLVSYRSMSVATHQARSSGYQMFAEYSQKGKAPSSRNDMTSSSGPRNSR